MNDTHTARRTILERLRQAASRPDDRPQKGTAVAAGTRLDTEALVKEFTGRAVLAGAVVKQITDLGSAGNEAAAFMKELGFSSALLSAESIVARSGMGAALAAAGVTVSGQTDDEKAHRELCFACDAGITGAFAGIAETGTVVLPLGDGYSRLISHAPPAHIVLLPAADIVPDTHHFWARMADGRSYAEKRAADFGKPHAGVRGRPPARPAAIVFVTGPSLTADIALTTVRGIHGPGKLLILLIDR